MFGGSAVLNGGGESKGGEAGGSFVIPGVGPTRHVYSDGGGGSMEIREVWADNLDDEFAVIREVVERYPYVAMDTEFPGVVARPVGDVGSQDYQYKTLKCNVDLLKIIQLGLSFADEKGRLPPDCPTWQFNFTFSLTEDMYAEDSIELLKNSGIDFHKHERHGIDVQRFGELMMTSGLVLMDNVRWISFHSGYDFGYLLKLLTCQALPADEASFFEVMRTYFPSFYDIKYLMTACQNLHGGLQKVSEDLKVRRIGPMHQAGSDSLLTAQTFFKLCESSFKGGVSSVVLDDSKFRCELFGLGHNHTVFRPVPQQQQQQQDGGGGGYYGRGGNKATNGMMGGRGLQQPPTPANSTASATSSSAAQGGGGGAGGGLLDGSGTASSTSASPSVGPSSSSLLTAASSPPQGPMSSANLANLMGTPGAQQGAEEAALQYLVPEQYSTTPQQQDGQQQQQAAPPASSSSSLFS